MKIRQKQLGIFSLHCIFSVSLKFVFVSVFRYVQQLLDEPVFYVLSPDFPGLQLIVE